jgi:hypothetical protein
MATALGDHPAVIATGVDRAEATAALVRGLATERGLLEELRGRLIEQRAALAADDTGTLEQVVHEIGRTLLTLREARRQRGLLMEMVTGESGGGLVEAAALVGGSEAEAIRGLGQDLHAAAVAASRELLINQTAIRRAIESGERFLQHLLTVPGGLPETGAASGVLLNQRA